jgi:hypothetical protein
MPAEPSGELHHEPRVLHRGELAAARIVGPGVFSQGIRGPPGIAYVCP